MKLATIAILAELAFCMDICNIEGFFLKNFRSFRKNFLALRGKWDCDQLQGKFTEKTQEKMLADHDNAHNFYQKANAKAAAIASIMGTVICTGT